MKKAQKKVTFSVPTDNPSTMSPKKKRGRPVGSGRKREGSDIPNTMTQKKRGEGLLGVGRRGKVC